MTDVILHIGNFCRFLNTGLRVGGGGWASLTTGKWLEEARRPRVSFGIRRTSKVETDYDATKYKDLRCEFRTRTVSSIMSNNQRPTQKRVKSRWPQKPTRPIDRSGVHVWFGKMLSARLLRSLSHVES